MFRRCVACLGTSEVADAAPSGLDYPEGVSQSSGKRGVMFVDVVFCNHYIFFQVLWHATRILFWDSVA